MKSITPGQKEDCWDGYKQVGMKKKGGKNVPNCVPEKISTFKERAYRGGIKDNDAEKATKLKIDREKKMNAKRHDSMLDRARNTDTKVKNKGMG